MGFQVEVHMGIGLGSVRYNVELVRGNNAGNMDRVWGERRLERVIAGRDSGKLYKVDRSSIRGHGVVDGYCERVLW